MTTELDAIYINNSQLFRANVYDLDGVTPLTPTSCTCSVWNKDTNTLVINNENGTVGADYAQYNWAGHATAARYEAVLTVTISAGVIKSEHFEITVLAKPPDFLPTSTLQRLIFALTEAVPAVGGVPTSTQYEQAVKDAVMEFSHQCGLTKFATLSIVSGTAAYSLPADFLRLIRLVALFGHDGVIISSGGLIPVSADWEEDYTIVNKQITFLPTPSYTLAREFKYKAGWVATAGDYPTLGEDEARIVLLKAKSIAFGKQSNAMAGTSLKYSFGAISEDLDGGSESSAQSASDIEKEFLAACNKYNGQVAMYG